MPRVCATVYITLHHWGRDPDRQVLSDLQCPRHVRLGMNEVPVAGGTRVGPFCDPYHADRGRIRPLRFPLGSFSTARTSGIEDHDEGTARPRNWDVRLAIGEPSGREAWNGISDAQTGNEDRLLRTELGVEDAVAHVKQGRDDQRDRYETTPAHARGSSDRK